MKSLLLATVLAVASILPAKAAVIQIVPVDPKTTDFRTGLPATVPAIIIVGKIEIGDAAKFREAAAKVPNYSIVAMASNGGKTFEAIEIGEITRKRGFATVVYDGHYCVSACGLIWLAGHQRFASPKAAIGFHATVNTRLGHEDGYGNASVGAYLARLGYGDDAIFYATNQPPDKVEWLSTESVKYGITWRFLP